jgi:response regulator RpfG family c-di-GMP phosphodiesterase
MSSGSRRLEDLRREAAAAALGLRGGEQTLVAALEAFQAENARVAETYHGMVRSLALALEARDGYTGEHGDAVERLAVAVAARIGLGPAQVADVQSARCCTTPASSASPTACCASPAASTTRSGR